MKARRKKPYVAANVSLRDYFAAQSMNATITKAGPYQNRCSPYSATTLSQEDFDRLLESIARSAYSMADAMLREREAK